MGERGTNILNVSKSAFNSLKKSDLVQRILDLKGKVVVDVDLYKLGGKIERNMNQIGAENKKFEGNMVILKNINHKLEEKIRRSLS